MRHYKITFSQDFSDKDINKKLDLIGVDSYEELFTLQPVKKEIVSQFSELIIPKTGE
jgi:hypothetical protein